ncbi:hypothetical protein AWB65_06379 [Caballeronia humi]|uniref:YhcG N-terminal domain-containing protein n=1 Tax=Caballeronia humi TaxID=326474 RepID=A0A158JE88_9BURK|nr:hypothetical protein AWB65_06379 [Caballeronia humi]
MLSPVAPQSEAARGECHRCRARSDHERRNERQHSAAGRVRGERAVTKNDIAPTAYAGLHRDIADVLTSTRAAAARSVNALMTATYWQIGRRIVEFEQGGEGRAAYGEALIRRLGADLSQRFGRGFGWRNLAQMRAFYLAWPAEQIVPTPSANSAARAVSGVPMRAVLEPAALAQAFRLPLYGS